MAVRAGMCVVERVHSSVKCERKVGTTASASSHGGSVENSSSVAAIKDLVKAFHSGFEKAINLVWSSELKEGAEDLRGTECRAYGWERRGVEIVNQKLNGEVSMG